MGVFLCKSIIWSLSNFKHSLPSKNVWTGSIESNHFIFIMTRMQHRVWEFFIFYDHLALEETRPVHVSCSHVLSQIKSNHAKRWPYSITTVFKKRPGCSNGVKQCNTCILQQHPHVGTLYSTPSLL